MAGIIDIMNRARALRQETALNSITPERAGGIMYDTLDYINQEQLQAANPLVISKIYDSVASMEADADPVSDLTGKALKPGQVVVIVTGDPDDPDDSVIYRYNGTEEGVSSWTAVGKLGGVAPYLEGYLYVGVATPATDPQTANITQKVFYRATEAGTYTDFDGLVVNAGEVCNLKWNGSAWSKEVTGAATKAELTELGSYVDNPEYIRAYTDAAGHFLCGIKVDGSIEWAKGVPQPIIDYIGRKFSDQEIQGLLDLLSVYYIYPDAEGRLQVITDKDQQIIAYRKADGTMVECVGMDVKAINAGALYTDLLSLSTTGMNQFKQALIDSGFEPGGHGDYSDEMLIELPIPKQCARINIIADHLPAYDGESVTAELEYFDGAVYFKKPIKKFKWQGDSSKTWHWKNYAFDTGDKSEWKFGGWVKQDSFHLKKYFADVLRGYSIISYRIAEQIYGTRAVGEQKPFEYLYENNSTQEGNGVFIKDFPSGALTHPDGFPFMLYHNGQLQGLYVFALKKDRANYNMKKKNADEIILDGSLNDGTIWGGSIDWSAFELRNPGDLINMSGADYEEGDEPIDSTSASWDGTNADMVRSADAKAIVQRLATALATIDVNNGGKTTEAKKTDFESFFNVPFLIDYFVFANAIGHGDGFNKNWIWCTWDGLLWSPTVYDCDYTFGNGNYGSPDTARSPLGISAVGSESNPANVLYRLYSTEIEARYKELRDAGIIDPKNLMSFFSKWIEEVGYDNLKIDLEECCVNSNGIPETPSYRDNNLKDGWILVSAASAGYPDFDPTKTYSSGEHCTWSTRYTLRATRTIAPSDSPLAGEPYEYVPICGGYHDSFVRICNWIKARIEYLDELFNY